MKTKMKKYQDGGRTISEKAAMRKVGKGKGTIAYKYGSDSAPGTEGNKGEYIGYSRKARKDSASGKTMGTSMKDAKAPRPVMKTGGMVNPNAKVQAAKVAGSKGVKPGVNPKASASSVATGRSGGTSVAPKTAIPKAQMGGMAGGRPISERAAARKVKKGKGMITKSYPSGPEEKGSYVGFSKEARKSNSPFKSMKDSKPARPIRKKGGAMKKGY